MSNVEENAGVASVVENVAENAGVASVVENVAEVDNLSKLTVKELKQKLRELQLPVTGARKSVLVERLKAAMQGDESEIDDDEDDLRASGGSKNDGEADSVVAFTDEAAGRSTGLPTVTNSNSTCPENVNLDTVIQLLSQVQQKSTIKFQDVADTIPSFSGEKGEHVTRWINNFEATAEMANWNDVEKIVNAKRKFVDSAKLFALYECQATTWIKFKAELVKEFASTVNSKQVHKQLATTKKRENESLTEFVYRMLQIASQIDIEIEAQIQYIIDGIPDDERNKVMLYGASSIKELRKKLKEYETFKNNISRKASEKTTSTDSTKKSSRSQEQTKRCFNCGGKNHLSNSCPDKQSGPKCFNCGEYGHIAPKCAKAGRSSDGEKKSKPRVDLLRCGDKKTYKMVEILGTKVNAVIDPGSDLHLASASLYMKLGAPELNPSRTIFSGVGSAGKSTLGKFRAEICIDDLVFDLEIEVIPDYFVGHDLLIGGEISDYAKVTFKNRVATFTPIAEESKPKDEIYEEILNINVLDEPEEEEYEAISEVTDAHTKNKLRQMINTYEPKKSKSSGVKLKIVLKDEIPVHQHPRRLSESQKVVVNKIIEDWYAKGIVRPSISEYASPIVLVEKKNKDYRLCVDYRQLNKKVLRDRNPLPLIEDQIDRLQNAKIFSTLDLKDGFFHVPVEESSVKYTSFVVPDGQWEFCRMPFGFANSPAVFQRHVRAVFHKLISERVVLVYLDDLIIPAIDEIEGLNKLKIVLETASEFGLIINWQKCKLMVTSVEYLGYIIEAGKYFPSERKTEAVGKFPVPRDVKQVQSFLGLTGYFRKFIPQFAARARCLSNLLKNDVKFQFGEEELAAFEDLKLALTTKPVLQLYRVEAETELHTDACMGGLGAILLQKNSEDGRFHPIYYASWKTSPGEEKYTSFELEFLAVVKAVKKFRVYLLGISFKIVTDCKAFALTLRKKDTCLRVSHWVLLLEQFKYTVEHRPGTSMRHVDSLSRNPINVMCTSIKNQTLTIKLQKCQKEDASLKEYFELVESGKPTDFELKGNGVLYRIKDGAEQLVIPKSMQYDIIKRAHDRGHFGWKKMEYLLTQDYWFPQMQKKVQKYISNCIRCVLAEKKAGKAEGFLNPINKGETPLEVYHIDFLGPIPSTKKNYNHLFVVIDAFSKFAWIYPTKSVTANEAIACLKKQSAVFGSPRSIISDRGAAFTSQAFTEYCAEENIMHTLITTGIPRGNGQVERLNRTIISVLTKLSLNQPMEWYKNITILQQMLNSTLQRSIGKTPFEVLIGTKMRFKDDHDLREMLNKEIIECFEEGRHQLREIARENLYKLQEENRKTYNKKRKEARVYAVGDLVAIQRTQFGVGLKVAPKYLGPYRVTSVMRNNRYLLEKVGEHEGPGATSSSADLMKPWPDTDGDDADLIESEDA